MSNNTDANERDEWAQRWCIPPSSASKQASEEAARGAGRADLRLVEAQPSSHPIKTGKDYYREAKAQLDRELRIKAERAPRQAKARAASKRRQAHRQVRLFSRLAKIAIHRARLAVGA